jgi:hypothetical protein
LDLVGSGASHEELSDAVAQMKAAERSAEDERARRARVHASRHFRWHQEETGGIRGSFFCDEVAWANVAPLIEAEARARWRGDDVASLEACRLDALIDLLAGAGSEAGPGSPSRPRSGTRVQTLVIIDAEALRRGTTVGDETCQIEGIGPVSVAAATELLGQGSLRFIVKEGHDIATVTSSTRSIPSDLATALVVRDRTCVVPHCAKRLGLEIDHAQVDFAQGGATELSNLVRLCPEHHALKTYAGWKIDGGPGHWRWVAPEHPKSATFIARAKRLAAAKAAAQRDQHHQRNQRKSDPDAGTESGDDRNRPRRT